MIKVLFLEDDKKLSESILKLLQLEGVHAVHVDSFESLEDQLQAPETFDVIILDRLIKSVDSKSYLQTIRNKWPRAGILMLSAINTPHERAELINLGADDYVGKPFSSTELLARIKSIARKYNFALSDYMILGNTTIDLMRRSISTGDKEEILPAKEFLLLKNLSNRKGLCTRTELLESVWGFDFQIESNVVESTMTNLRKKLTSVGSSIQIKNSRNSGYWLEA